MPNGGRLTAKASETGEATFIDVQDTGVGIRGENMDKLFRPLFTLRARGTGLGLSGCERLVEAHNGTIMVQSKTGKGTTVTVKIPP